MPLESSKKVNNQTGLGEWLEGEDLIPNRNDSIQTLLWPGNPGLAASLEQTNDIDRIMACGPNSHNVFYKDLSQTVAVPYTTHELSTASEDESFNSENMFDLEYGWAINSDLTRDYKDSLESHKEGLKRIAETSKKHLRPGSTAVYNLGDVGDYFVNPVAEQFDDYREAEEAYAEVFQDVLEDYFEDVEVYSDHSMEHRNTHVVGQNLDECSNYENTHVFQNRLNPEQRRYNGNQ